MINSKFVRKSEKVRCTGVCVILRGRYIEVLLYINLTIKKKIKDSYIYYKSDNKYDFYPPFV